jgi:hypothetical protein
VEKSVDKAKCGFFAWSVAKASRIGGDDTGSDQNLSVREGNNIGRRWITEEGPVHFGNCAIAEDCCLDLLEFT